MLWLYTSRIRKENLFCFLGQRLCLVAILRYPRNIPVLPSRDALDGWLCGNRLC